MTLSLSYSAPVIERKTFFLLNDIIDSSEDLDLIARILTVFLNHTLDISSDLTIPSPLIKKVRALQKEYNSLCSSKNNDLSEKQAYIDLEILKWIEKIKGLSPFEKQEFVKERKHEKSIIEQFPSLRFNANGYIKNKNEENIELMRVYFDTQSQKTVTNTVQLIHTLLNKKKDPKGILNVLLDHLGNARFKIAYKQQSMESQYFGVKRSNQLFTPFEYYGSYLEYRNFLYASLKNYVDWENIQPFKISSEKIENGYTSSFNLHLLSPEDLKNYLPVYKYTKIPIPPQAALASMTLEKGGVQCITTQFLLSLENGPPGTSIVIHQDPKYFQLMSKWADECFQKCFEPFETEVELKTNVALLRYLLSQASFYKRGSATISEWIEKSIYEFHGYIFTYQNPIGPSNRRPSGDLDAFTNLTLSQFLANYLLKAKIEKMKIPDIKAVPDNSTEPSVSDDFFLGLKEPNLKEFFKQITPETLETSALVSLKTFCLMNPITISDIKELFAFSKDSPIALRIFSFKNLAIDLLGQVPLSANDLEILLELVSNNYFIQYSIPPVLLKTYLSIESKPSCNDLKSFFKAVIKISPLESEEISFFLSEYLSSEPKPSSNDLKEIFIAVCSASWRDSEIAAPALNAYLSSKPDLSLNDLKEILTDETTQDCIYETAMLVFLKHYLSLKPKPSIDDLKELFINVMFKEECDLLWRFNFIKEYLALEPKPSNADLELIWSQFIDSIGEEDALNLLGFIAEDKLEIPKSILSKIENKASEVRIK